MNRSSSRWYRRASFNALVLILLASGVLAAGAWLTWAFRPRAELGAKAALYALPLVIMDLTREETTAVPGAADAAVNRFRHLPTLANPRFRAVVRPNVDTIYSTAWLDLAAEPVLMTLPPSNGRYFMIQCMDAWTNVFADPGIRTLGNKGATYAITGPDWHGSLPEGVTEIRAPTRMVWVLGRVYVRDQADLPAARAYQQQLDIRPLSRSSDASFRSAYPHPAGRNAKRPIMMDLLKSIGPEAFFERFMKLTVANPPAPQDAQFIKDVLEPLGLAPGKPAGWESIGYFNRRALAFALERVLDRLADRTSLERQRMVTPSGWSGMSEKTPQGSYGTNYPVRAAVAVLGLGANLRADAVYFNASGDGNGKRLDGGKHYHLTFAAGKAPPERGFWSVTLYDDKGYLVASPIGRYAIKSGDDLVYQPDGSLVIYLQPDDPDRIIAPTGFPHRGASPLSSLYGPIGPRKRCWRADGSRPPWCQARVRRGWARTTSASCANC